MLKKSTIPKPKSKSLLSSKSGSRHIFPKMEINKPGDKYEQEADAMADSVIRSTSKSTAIKSGSAAKGDSAQRKCEACEEEEKNNKAVMRKTGDSGHGVEASPSLISHIRSSAGGGSPLQPAVKNIMENAFSTDFSSVRVHTDGIANSMNKDIHAKAFTYGNDIYFNQGQHSPETQSGQKLLAHELTHVIQQSQQKVQPQLQRAPFTIGSGRRARTFQSGNVRFEKKAKDEMLKAGILLPSADQAHIAFNGDLLGYETNYVPTDPFRWNKMKDIIDSGEKVLVKKVSLTDTFDVLFIDPKLPGGRMVMTGRSLATSAAEGLTLTKESIHKAIFPNDTTVTASPIADTSIIFYSTDISNPTDSSLAHELLGHFWLALKRVPYAHPKTQPQLGTHGTLTAQHGILDPFGNPYSGTVLNFIDTYVGSGKGTLHSPTQNVGNQLYQDALKNFIAAFATGTTGALNQAWTVSPAAYLQWTIISNNYIVAPAAPPATTQPAATTGTQTTTPATPASTSTQRSTQSSSPAPITPGASTAITTVTKAGIQTSIAKWYSSQSINKQYVFIKMLKEDQLNFLSRSTIATDLLNKLTRPAGMLGP
jgi:Domain of unknown function (DUF4157)